MRFKINSYLLVLGSLWVAISAAGCQATRFLGPDEFLIKNSPKIRGNEAIKSEILSQSIDTSPNRRMLAPKVYLHLYNTGLALRQDSSWVKRGLFKIPQFQRFHSEAVKWLLNDIGERPALLDTTLLNSDLKNLRNTYFASGYFNPEIAYEIDTINNWFEKKKVNISFQIKENEAFVINQVSYELDTLADELSKRQFWQAYDTSKSILKRGTNYNHKAFEQERARATNALRNQGYYTFNDNMVSFRVDTTLSISPVPVKNRYINILVRIAELPQTYKINDVKLTLRANSDSPMADTVTVIPLDSINLKKFNVSDKSYSPELPFEFKVTRTIIKDIDFNFIGRRIFILPDSLFRLNNAKLTQRRLQELQMFQFLVINYDLIEEKGLIDVEIEMLLAPHYQLKLGTEAFTTDLRTSNNLPVVGGNLGFRNRNTFGRSEFMELSLGANVGFYAGNLNENQLDNLFFEISGGANFSIPRFLIPFRSPAKEVLRNPTTTFAASFRGEFRAEYDRFTSGINLQYRWDHKQSNKELLMSSQLIPLSIDFISTRNINASFQEEIDQLPRNIQRDYQSRFSSRFAYSFIYSTYMLSRLRPSYYFRFNAEIGGNLPWLLERIIGDDTDKQDNFLTLIPSIIDTVAYGQYFKTSVEGKYFLPINRRTELVFRGIIGYAQAYNFTSIVPQESRFFTGGTNSMRGWQSNTLGPGILSLDALRTESSDDQNVSSLIAPGGEVKFEMNAELRFDVYSYLEMALFTDLGNVWFGQQPSNEIEEAEQATLSSNTLKLGWDAGLGFRFDFDFLILRIDIARQLFAPDLLSMGMRGWLFRRNSAAGNRTQFNLGIGYPF